MVDCHSDWSDDRADSAIGAWIKRKLGCDIIGVELSEEQLADAISDSREYWMMWVGRVRMVNLSLTSSREYPADAIGPDVDSVVDVFFDVKNEGWTDIYGWADVELNPFQYTYEGRGGYSGLAQYMMYRDDVRKITSADRDWQWDRARRTLILSPVHADLTNVMVSYLSRCFDYGVLSTYEWKLFKDYALMSAMKTLATIRMKFPEKPSATGTFTMDGSEMWANAEAMEMRIEEKMERMSRPIAIITD